MTSPRFMIVKVTLSERPDGGLRVTSDTLPNLLLSGADRDFVFHNIAPTIKVLLGYQGIKDALVECAVSAKEVFEKGPPCDVDVHVRTSEYSVEKEFVVVLNAA